MSWNDHVVIDIDAHIRERVDKFFKDYIDPEYCAPFNLLCEAIAKQQEKGDRYALFGSRTAVVEQIEAGRALGVRDTFGSTDSKGPKNDFRRRGSDRGVAQCDRDADPRDPHQAPRRRRRTSTGRALAPRTLRKC